MSQITLLIIEFIICQLVLLILYKKYGKTGLYAYCSIALLLSSIMSLKTISLFEYDLNLGMIPFATIFTSSNILIQKNGIEDAKTLLLTAVTSSLLGYIILYLISLMSPSNINLFSSASYDNIFNNSIRMFFATFVTTLYSLLLNMKLYYYLKRIKNNILVSNLFSAIIIYFVASILFGLIAFIFTKEAIDIVKIIMIRYLTCLCIGILSTIVIYISKFIKEKK
jgi:uncharacterized integral membrane protein (TIGR00697 family)